MKHKGQPSYKRWEHSEKGKKYMTAYHVTYKARFKKIVYDFYGWKCNCCGEQTPQFLSIDHVNGGGTKERLTLTRNLPALYKKIIKEGFPTTYQVLCHNCNLSKGYYKICPHQV